MRRPHEGVARVGAAGVGRTLGELPLLGGSVYLNGLCDAERPSQEVERTRRVDGDAAARRRVAERDVFLRARSLPLFPL